VTDVLTWALLVGCLFVAVVSALNVFGLARGRLRSDSLGRAQSLAFGMSGAQAGVRGTPGRYHRIRVGDVKVPAPHGGEHTVGSRRDLVLLVPFVLLIVLESLDCQRERAAPVELGAVKGDGRFPQLLGRCEILTHLSLSPLAA